MIWLVILIILSGIGLFIMFQLNENLNIDTSKVSSDWLNEYNDEEIKR